MPPKKISLINSIRVVKGLQNAWNSFVDWRQAKERQAAAKKLAKNIAWVVGFALAALYGYTNQEFVNELNEVLLYILQWFD